MENDNIIKHFSMCSGYGGAEFGLQLANIKYKSVGYSEIDKYAIKIFEQNHPGIKNYGDCTKLNIDEIPDFDLLTAGFPCQSFSIAGKKKGFKDTRGTIIYDILRVASIKKPKYMLLENVKGLISHDNGVSIKIILNAIRDIGYDVIYKVLNSSDYGIPQNRERVWFVCKLGKFDFGEFMFPVKTNKCINVNTLINDNVDNKYYVSDMKKDFILRNKLFINFNRKRFNTLTASQYKLGKEHCKNLVSDFRYDDGLRLRYNNISPTLSATFKPSSISGCVLNVSNIDISKNDYSSIIKNIKIRRLTPIECFRLMGFITINININGLSDTQLYKLSGNGWEINVVSKILKQMYKK